MSDAERAKQLQGYLAEAPTPTDWIERLMELIKMSVCKTIMLEASRRSVPCASLSVPDVFPGCLPKNS